MPQLYDAETGSTAEPPKPKPTYGGRLKPNVVVSSQQVQKAYGKGTVLVTADRAINQQHVETAIDRWNAVADAPIFKFIPSRHMADVVIRFGKAPGKQGYQGWGEYPDASARPSYITLTSETPYRDKPYQNPSLIEHELGHTLGLGHPYDVGSPTIGFGGISPAEQAALTAASMSWWPDSVLQNPNGGHRIMAAVTSGSPSLAEAQVAASQLGFTHAFLELYRAVEARLQNVGA